MCLLDLLDIVHAFALCQPPILSYTPITGPPTSHTAHTSPPCAQLPPARVPAPGVSVAIRPCGPSDVTEEACRERLCTWRAGLHVGPSCQHPVSRSLPQLVPGTTFPQPGERRHTRKSACTPMHSECAGLHNLSPPSSALHVHFSLPLLGHTGPHGSGGMRLLYPHVPGDDTGEAHWGSHHRCFAVWCGVHVRGGVSSVMTCMRPVASHARDGSDRALHASRGLAQGVPA